MQETSLLATDPDTAEIGTPEEIPFTVDYSPRLGSGESVGAVTLTQLTDIMSGRVDDSALVGLPSVQGPFVIQMIVGANLRRGRSVYEYVTAARIDPGGRVEATITKIDVMF